MKNKKMKHLQTFENYKIDESWRSPLSIILGGLFTAALPFISAIPAHYRTKKEMTQAYNPKFADLKRNLDELQQNVEDEELRDLSSRVESLMSMEASRRMQDTVREICVDLQEYMTVNAPDLSREIEITDSIQRVINGDFQNVDEDIKCVKEIYDQYNQETPGQRFAKHPIIATILILLLIILGMVKWFFVGTMLDAFIGFDDRRRR